MWDGPSKERNKTMNQSRFVVFGLFVFSMFCWSGIPLGEAASLMSDGVKVKAQSGDVTVTSQPGLPQLWLKSEEGKIGGARLQLVKNTKGKAKHSGKHADGQGKGKRKNGKGKADKGKTEKVQESKETKDRAQNRGRGRDESRMRGLDRADEMAGEHGQHGRAKARTNQRRSNTTN
jgi:hypothetical protein